MLKRIQSCLFIVLTFLAFNISAAELTGLEADLKIKGAGKIITGSKSNIPDFVQFREEAMIDVEKFSSWAHGTFSLSHKYGFKLLSTEKDQIGMVHYRYQQTYSGFPVQGTMYIVHTKNNKIVSVNGNLFDGLNPAETVVLNESSALSKALTYMNADLYRWQVPGMEEHLKMVMEDPSATWFPKGELMLAPVGGKFKAENYRMAYRFDIYAEKPEKREYVFVDAASGEIIYTQNRIHTANSQATAQTRYSETRAMTTDSVAPASFRLRETGRGLGIETYNILTTTNLGGAVDFNDSDNNWNNVNAQQDEVASDAHWGAEVTYDYYLNKFGRNSVNNAGQKLLSYVHYANNYINASWDGTQMKYGDGNAGLGYSPFTCLDITGHEISHGVTEFTSALNYANESGALNESFSDCMGNSIRQYGKNNGSIVWLIGEEVGPPLRNMSNPNQFNNPDTYLGTFWYSGTADNGGVHTNSGVMNFWYYLLTEGGTGTNDNGDSYSVTGLGLNTAAGICYRMNALYLFPGAEYIDARNYSIQAAIDLYGACSNEVIQTVNAWYAVGVGSAYVAGVHSDFSAPVTLFCKPAAIIRFTNLSSNGGYYTWDFGDGLTQSHALNPTHIYTSYGNYTVTLTADGGACGIDSMKKIQYISIDSINPCVVLLPKWGDGDIQTDCSGQLFDSGGPSENYADSTDGSITIAPPGASVVTLTFNLFDFEAGFDYLYVYDGPTVSSPLIGRYDGTSLPNGGTITSTTGSITVRQVTDEGLSRPGFALTWQCTMSTVPPFASFDTEDTVTCSGFVQFNDRSTDGPISWHWDFGDGDTSNLQNPSHTYSANGPYTVVLTVSNSFGNDVSGRVDYITVDRPAAPVGSDVSACTGTSATLSATGPGIITWYQDSTGVTVVDTGSTIQTPPIPGNTTYYAESDIYPSSQYVGPLNNTFGGGGNFGNNSYRSQIFDVLSQMRLVSVKVYAQGTSNRTIRLVKGGVTLRTLTVNIQNGESRVILNWDIPVGSNYELACPGSANLYRNNSNSSYPYTLSGLVSITGNSVGSTANYYFFYNWEVKGPPCVSVRTPIRVNALPPPVASFNSSVVVDSVAFFDNSTNAAHWLWNFDDPASGVNDTSTSPNPSHLFSSNGTFQVCLQVTDGAGCTDSSCQSFLIAGLDHNIKGNTEFSVFPNPVNDVLSIHFKEASSLKKCSVKLIDVLGKTVAEKIITPFQTGGKFEWDLSSLAPGAYMLELESENQRLMERIIRQ